MEMTHKNEYVILLDLLANAISTTEVSSIEDSNERERLKYAHLLANRFIQYALTVLYLSSGTKVQNLPSLPKQSFTDIASIDVITRASMEAFLVFHYVFCAPTTQEERYYRYWAFKANGIAERKDFPSNTEHEERRESDSRELEELKSKLDSNPIFRSLEQKQREHIFEGKGKWKYKPSMRAELSWRAIATDAGFGKMLALYMYKHLCGHAHSSSLSVLQTQQALLSGDTEKLIQSSIDTMNVLTANMIWEYCRLFSKAEDVLQASGASGLVGAWIEIGRRLDENLDAGQDSD